MKTRTTGPHTTLEEGFLKFTESKLAQLKAGGKQKKEKTLMSEIQSIWKQLSYADKCKWSTKPVGSDSKGTPIKKAARKSKAPTKIMPATSSTAKKNNSSKKKLQSEDKEQEAQQEEKGIIAKQLFTGKSKKIKKQNMRVSKAEQYQNFYKFHFNKLKEEHPNWNAEKVTQIISLMWKKAKMESKFTTQKEVEEVYQKILTGKEAFKVEKLSNGVKEDEVEKLWSRLPVEAKRKWQMQGNGFAVEKSSKKPSKMKFAKSEQPYQQNQLSFMKKKM